MHSTVRYCCGTLRSVACPAAASAVVTVVVPSLVKWLVQALLRCRTSDCNSFVHIILCTGTGRFAGSAAANFGWHWRVLTTRSGRVMVGSGQMAHGRRGGMQLHA
ncbi:hypothetical protein COO60DRAFT_1202369 [Scenedesmus sp. NREL 46B-D3]|nr:hypothetical protein COO60DRAFT_1202369 [Scenedesmus sp. NREL 46B-D3]